MQAKRAVMWAVAIGMGIGFGGASAIHAWQMKTAPGYIISEAEEFTDPAALQEYGAKVRQTLAPFDPQFVIAGGKATTLDGAPPKGIVVIRFESVQKAKAWYDSAEYQAILPLRQKGAKGRMFVVEGVAPKP